MQWNIKEAARECGIPPASWGSWENGAMPHRYTEKCRLIAERTGCDYGWLVLGPATNGKHVIDWNPVKAEKVTRPHRHRSRGREITRTGSPSGRGDSRRPVTPRRTSRLPRPDAA